MAAWYLKAADYLHFVASCECAFVATKSICQGEQVVMLWPLIFGQGLEISFAHRPFHWSNLASSNAGVTVVIVGIAPARSSKKIIYDEDEKRSVENIGPYLIPMGNIIVEKTSRPISGLPRMDYGNKPTDGGNLILDCEAKGALIDMYPYSAKFIKSYVGSSEFINGVRRFCISVEDRDVEEANLIQLGRFGTIPPARYGPRLGLTADEPGAMSRI